MQHYYTKVNEVTRIKAMPAILACAAEVPGHSQLQRRRTHLLANRGARSLRKFRWKGRTPYGAAFRATRASAHPSVSLRRTTFKSFSTRQSCRI